MKGKLKAIVFVLLLMLLTACSDDKDKEETKLPKPTPSVQETDTKPVSVHGERVIMIDGMKNVRDLGGLVTTEGKTIKKGLVLRGSEMSGNYANITEQGKKTLMENYKIKTELDLRKDSEALDNGVQVTGSKLGSEVRYVHMSAKDYYDFIKGSSNEADILRIFADYDNYPILFHCIYGADRTGTVAFVLESLVGVPYDDLVMDYELTEGRDREYEPYVILATVYEKKLEGDSYQDKTYRVCKNVFGLTEMEISNIFNIFLTDSAVFEADSLTKPYSVSGKEIVFHLNMRESVSVQSVEYNGNKVEFQLDGNALCLSNVVVTDQAKGTITFDDGATLSFEV